MATSSLEFSLGEPLWLFALVGVPLIAVLFYLGQRRGEKLVERIVSPRLKSMLAGSVSKGLRLVRALLILSALALGVVCLAKPRSGYIEQEIKQRGRDVILAFDVSRSMLATDVMPTRLARAKLFARDLLGDLGNDRVGVIAFAGSAFLQAPLTQDQTAILETVDELDTDLIPRGGTNLAAAIDTALKAFGEGEGVTRALVIVTDGEELDADGLAAARRAEEKHVRIITVGVGSKEGSLIPIQSPNGQADFVRDDSGKPVMTRLDEARLKEIAEITGGFYQPLNEGAAGNVFEKGIVPLEETLQKSAASRVPIENYQIPLAVAVGLVVFWLLLGERKWSALFAKRRSRVVEKAALFVGLMGVSNMAAWTQTNGNGVSAPTDSSPGSGVTQPVRGTDSNTNTNKYERGDFAGALKDYESKLAQDPEADKLNFNAGASAYRLGNFAKAVDHFTKALLTQDKKLQEEANYNLGNSLVRRGEQAKENESKKKDWENAIEYYDQALKLNSQDTRAKENIEVVKKLLEDLKKKEEEQKKQDQQKQDQQKQDQQKQDQQKQDQQKQDQQKQDQQKQDQQKQDQQKQDQQKQDQQKQDQQKQDQQKQDQQKQDQQKQDQQKQDQQKQDQQKQDQQKQDQQKQDQQKQDQQKQDQQKQDQQKQDQQKQDQQKQDQQKQDELKQDQQKQDEPQSQSSKPDKGDEPLPKMPEPGEKKEGQLQSAKPEEQGEESVQVADQEEKDGKMSEAQARALLRSLQNEEDRVRMMQRQEQREVTRDW